MNLFWGKLWFVSLSNSWDAASLQTLLCSGEADMQSIAICSTHFRCRAAILPRLRHDLDHHCVHTCKGFGGLLYIIIYIIYDIYKLYKSCIFARVWVVEPAASGKQHFLSLFNNRDSHPCHQKYLKNKLKQGPGWTNIACNFHILWNVEQFWKLLWIKKKLLWGIFIVKMCIAHCKGLSLISEIVIWFNFIFSLYRQLCFNTKACIS